MKGLLNVSTTVQCFVMLLYSFILVSYYSITYLLVGNTISNFFYLKFVTATNLVSYFLFLKHCAVLLRQQLNSIGPKSF